VGIVEDIGSGVTKFKKGCRAGATWIFSSCGVCSFCRRGLENANQTIAVLKAGKNPGSKILRIIG